MSYAILDHNVTLHDLRRHRSAAYECTRRIRGESIRYPTVGSIVSLRQFGGEDDRTVDPMIVEEPVNLC